MPAFEREVLVDWADGDCVLRMSVPINGGPPSPRPRITGDLILIVDRYSADGRRQSPHVRVFLGIPLLDATRLAVVPFARDDVVHEVVWGWSLHPCYGMLPDDLVLFLAEALSMFFRGVAAEIRPAPDITYVSAVARARVFDAMQEEEEEEEAGGNGVEMEEEDAEEPSSTTAPPEGEEEEVRDAEGEEESRCAICLRRMESGDAAEGRRERRWLPCCHSFHRGCLHRWLRRKAECPLCRAPAAASAGGGGGGQQRDS